jgi:osmoprotectant transport system permease protein
MKKSTGKNQPAVTTDFVRIFSSQRFVIWMVVCYVIFIVLLLLAELDIGNFVHFRATDKVLILVALLFMPFFIMATPKLVDTLTVKFGGGHEVQVKLNEVSEKVEAAFVDIETNVSRQVSTAEQALWPMLAGHNPFANERWQAARPQIIIGSKLDISHVFLANFLKRWLEEKLDNVECIVRVPNGGSLKNFADVKHRWIDLYIDFTGTCCQYFNIDHRQKNDSEIIAELNDYCAAIDLKFLNPLGATENYLLVMKKDVADEYGIKTISHLSLVAEQLIFTADPEYLNRRDCWLGLQDVYGIKFREIHPCKVTERYALAETDQAQVFVGYETDPEIKKYRMVELTDDEEFFPRYAAVPLLNRGVLEAVPGLGEALMQLENKISTEDLIFAVHKLSVNNCDKRAVEELTEKQLRKILG